MQAVVAQAPAPRQKQRWLRFANRKPALSGVAVAWHTPPATAPASRSFYLDVTRRHCAEKQSQLKLLLRHCALSLRWLFCFIIGSFMNNAGNIQKRMRAPAQSQHHSPCVAKCSLLASKPAIAVQRKPLDMYSLRSSRLCGLIIFPRRLRLRCAKNSPPRTKS